MTLSKLPEVVWTIGHSTHPIERFVAMLRSHEIEVLADIRRFAGSRRNPQYSPAALKGSVEEARLQYLAIPELGGRRKPDPESVNTAWRNDAFRGYADFMKSDEYARGVEAMIAQAVVSRTAIMCSEAVWWRCHRSLVSDDLKARGVRVLHIMSEGTAKEHPFTSAARIVSGALSYREE